MITVLMTLTIYRIYYINMADYLTMAADVQGRYILDIAQTRGVIYDRNMRSMVNRSYDYIASVMPTPQAASALLPVFPEEEQPALLERLSDARPFALSLPHNNIYAQGVDIFRVPQRYGENQLAPHVIGYLSGDRQNGVAGIEKAYDDFLSATGTRIKISYRADAMGQVMQGAAIGVERSGEEDPIGGVVLTLDSDIQNLTQNALANNIDKGAAVVMDIYTGDILAMASLPTFDQNDIASSFESADAPFINRAVSGYNIGSIFKLVVSTAALQNGISTSFEHECEGSIDINGQVFRCNFSAIHGVVDMPRALQVSCNTYFIKLAQEIEPRYLIATAENLGLGRQIELAPGVQTQSGNLPTASELSNAAAYANFSFGQGSSLATPLQMAQVVASLANSGMGVSPRLVRGVTLEGAGLSEEFPIYASNQVISESTSRIMRDLMVGVIEEGSGRTAKPLQGGAGGKTSSAQTGQYVDDVETVHAWFAGFYPAEQPQYSIVVFAEGGESGEQVAAPIFKQICDGISGLGK